MHLSLRRPRGRAGDGPLISLRTIALLRSNGSYARGETASKIVETHHVRTSHSVRREALRCPWLPGRSATMKAVLCSSFTGTQDLRICEIDEPEPAGDEILIDVHAASVSFMDHLLVSGLYQMRPSLPFVPGTEAAGIVRSVGDKVTRFKPGDRVACWNWTGGYAERMVARESKSVRLPAGAAFETSATVWHNYGTAHYALVERAQARRGETLFVTGAAGGVGLAAADLGSYLGLRVIAGVGSDAKADFMRGYGVSEVINYG